MGLYERVFFQQQFRNWNLNTVTDHNSIWYFISFPQNCQFTFFFYGEINISTKLLIRKIFINIGCKFGKKETF